MQDTMSGIHMDNTSVGSYTSQSTSEFIFSLLITKTSRNQSLNFIANKTEIRDIKFRSDNTKHLACQETSFSSYNSATLPEDSVIFQRYKSSLINTNPDYVTSIKRLPVLKYTHGKLNEEQEANLPIKHK